MNNRLLFIIISFFFMVCPLCGEPIITFFLQKYPVDQQEAEKTVKKLQKPGKIAKRLLERHFNPVAGIFATYGGFLQISSPNGQIMFPRKHAAPTAFLIITTQLEPVTLMANTLSHWELVPGVPTQAFCMTQQQDPDTKQTLWQVLESELPPDNRVPHEAIVLFMPPKRIVVPTGVSIGQPGPNLQLPDLYVKKGIDATKNSLYVLTLTLFFRTSNNRYEKKVDRYETLIE